MATNIVIDTKQNRELLYKYLIKDYLKYGNTLDEAKKKARAVITKNKNNLFGKNGIAVRLGRRSLEFFAMYFLQNTFLPNEENGASPIAPVHSEIWQGIEEAILYNTIDRLGYVLPRGTGKSAFGNFSTCMWTMTYHLREYALICSNTGDNAEKFIKQVKIDLLENPFIKEGFGDLLIQNDKRYVVNSIHLDLVNGCSIESISSQSSMRGRKNSRNQRPDLIILDDYQDENDTRTEQARQKKWDRFSEDVKFVGQRPTIKDGKVVRHGTTFIALGTLQHEECIYSRLKKLPTWKFVHKKGVLVEDIDELFNSGLWLEFKKILHNSDDDNRLENAKEFYWQHEEEMKYPLLWESYWNSLIMALDYYENPIAFHQEIQGDVAGIGQRKFKTIVSIPKAQIEEKILEKCMLCIDPAGNNVKDKKKSDYYAFCVGGITSNNIKYVLKGEILRMDFDKYIKHTIELLKTYKKITHVYIEKNTYQGVDVARIKEFINNDDELYYRDIEFINEMQRKNKDEKINTIVGEVSNGSIIFSDEDQEFIQQIKDFAGCDFSKHDDAPDIVAEFANRIIDIEVPCEIRLLKFR